MECVGIICAKSARKMAKELKMAEREELRTIGRKKLEQYRLLKQTLLGGDLNQMLHKAATFSPTATAALGSPTSHAGIIAAFRPKTFSEGDSPSSSCGRTSLDSPGLSLATRMSSSVDGAGATDASGFSTPSSPSIRGSTLTAAAASHRLSHRTSAVDAAALAAVAPAAADPLIDMLLVQVQALMADKQNLQQQVDELLRENEQLSELVGYLSSVQPQDVLEGQLSTSAHLSTSGSVGWFFQTVPRTSSSAADASVLPEGALIAADPPLAAADKFLVAQEHSFGTATQHLDLDAPPVAGATPAALQGTTSPAGMAAGPTCVAEVTAVVAAADEAADAVPACTPAAEPWNSPAQEPVAAVPAKDLEQCSRGSAPAATADGYGPTLPLDDVSPDSPGPKTLSSHCSTASVHASPSSSPTSSSHAASPSSIHTSPGASHPPAEASHAADQLLGPVTAAPDRSNTLDLYATGPLQWQLSEAATIGSDTEEDRKLDLMGASTRELDRGSSDGLHLSLPMPPTSL